MKTLGETILEQKKLLKAKPIDLDALKDNQDRMASFKETRPEDDGIEYLDRLR